MEGIIESIELCVHYAVEFSIVFMEFLGLCVLFVTAVKCFRGWIQGNEGIRLDLGEGIALALEFKLGGEVLRTVIIREKSELLILGAIIFLRGVLTFLIHWEIKNEEKALEKKAATPEGLLFGKLRPKQEPETDHTEI